MLDNEKECSCTKCGCGLQLPGDTSLTPMCCRAESDTISRKKANDIFSTNWCIVCGKTVEFKTVPTHMPGILAANCGECGKHYHANFLESDDDLIRIPKNSKLP